jgi:hypothetical protein
MRAGPLSNEKIIALLNACFVPVYLSNEDYVKDGSASAAEKAEFWRFYNGFAIGTVAVNLLTPEGKGIISLHVVDASKPDYLLTKLQEVITSLGVVPGAPVMKPHPQSTPPAAEEGSLFVHLTARGLTPADGSTSTEFPAETWLVFKPAEVPKLLPPDPPVVGASWSVDPEMSKRILIHFYPQTISSDRPENNIILQQSLTGRVISIQNGVVRARLDAQLLMNRSYYNPPRGDARLVKARLVGYVDFMPNRSHIHAIGLTTYKATYDGKDFEAGLLSLPHLYAVPGETAGGQQ